MTRDPSDPSGQLGAARAALSGERHPLREADLPNAAGLYALYGDPAAWHELQLGEPPDGRPLYVGKAELSLLTRDVRTHLRAGRTSTIRKSLCALLPGGIDGERLTAWMQDRLEIAVWPSPPGAQLVDIERWLLEQWQPPLNLVGVRTPWTAVVKEARKALAD